MNSPKNKPVLVDPQQVKTPHPVTVEFIKKLELQEGKRYLLFIDSKNLTFDSAHDLAEAMAVHGYNVSLVLTDGDPNVVAVESSLVTELPEGSREVKLEEKHDTTKS